MSLLPAILDVPERFGACDLALVRLDLDLPDADVVAVLETLEPDRRARLLRYHRAVDIHRGALADVLARSLVAARTGGDPADVRLTRERSGRPLIDDGPCISLAHAGRWVACAAADFPVGVDVEVCQTRAPSVSGVASPAECLEGRLRWRRVIQAWTAKESYLKMLGTGLQIDPGDVQLTRMVGYLQVRGPAGRPSGRVRLIDLDEQHQIAVCAPEVPAPATTHISSHELVRAYLAGASPLATRSF